MNGLKRPSVQLKKLEQRKFGQLLKKMKKGDMLIVSELSRMGRNLMQIMKILHDCVEKDIQVLPLKSVTNWEIKLSS